VTETIVIRAAAREDYAEWKPLWDGYNAFYGREGPTTLPGEVTETTWSRFFDPTEPMHALVAQSSGTLVGLAHYLFHRSTNQLALTCYLQDLYTAKDARGRGVGHALIEAVCERAKAAGSSRLYWHTQQGNATARRLYDRITDDCGFVVYRKAL
jgi:GNAT superfamily N-acetyltransferase